MYRDILGLSGARPWPDCFSICACHRVSTLGLLESLELLLTLWRGGLGKSGCWGSKASPAVKFVMHPDAPQEDSGGGVTIADIPQDFGEGTGFLPQSPATESIPTARKGLGKPELFGISGGGCKAEQSPWRCGAGMRAASGGREERMEGDGSTAETATVQSSTPGRASSSLN